MTTTFARLLADAFALFRREASILLSIAAPLLFLPAFAVQLLTDPLPPLPASPRTEAALSAWFDAVSAWGQTNAIWYLLADAVGLIGMAAIAMLLVDPARPDVRTALSGACRRFPRYALASVLVAIPVGLGLWLLILPGLYAQARLVAILPVLAGGRPVSATAALARSLRVTRRAQIAVFGAVVALFLAQWLFASPLMPLEAWLRASGHENPVALSLVDAGLAAIGAAFHLALLLVGIVTYRRFASSGT